MQNDPILKPASQQPQALTPADAAMLAKAIMDEKIQRTNELTRQRLPYVLMGILAILVAVMALAFSTKL